MLLRDWRNQNGLGLAAMARLLGIGGVNPGGTLARIECGSRQPDADMLERISALTAFKVTANDLYASRLDWLKRHRPEKFGDAVQAFLPPGSEAAE